ncbi:MAG: hypothetical protein AAFQ55_17130 [Pseudomonadota bacterium]
MLDGASTLSVVAIAALTLAGFGLGRLTVTHSKKYAKTGDYSNITQVTILVLNEDDGRDFAQLVAELGAGVNSDAAKLLREDGEEGDDPDES